MQGLNDDNLTHSGVTECYRVVRVSIGDKWSFLAWSLTSERLESDHEIFMESYSWRNGIQYHYSSDRRMLGGL